jgi:NADPH-dependent glutamate synthase beta subunit-like oxidoreductase/ferredoxin
MRGLYGGVLRGQYDISMLKELAGTVGKLDSESIKTGPKVAIVGSGVAGLTAAHDLAILGYQVTVFESHSVAGGMLNQGVPLFRLDRDLVAQEIRAIEEMGVKIRTHCKIGKDFTIQDLRDQGFSAVLIAIGLHEGRPLKIEGVDQEGVLSGIAFLREANGGKKFKLGKKVVVIGGGNVAMDCARTALRCQPEEVYITCLEARHQMRAAEVEIEEAQHEGIHLHPAVGPKRILGTGGKVTGLETWKVDKLFDSEGRFNPTFIPDTEKVFEADNVILAIGQMANFDVLKGEGDKVVLTRMGTVQVDKALRTSVPDIFAAGDIAHGPKLFITAVEHGHIAARSIHEYLGNRKIRVARVGKMEVLSPYKVMDENYTNISRDEPPVKHQEGKTTNDLIEIGFNQRMAVEQANRCLGCNVNVVMNGELCIGCAGCVDVCPEFVLKMVPMGQTEGDQALSQATQETYRIPLQAFQDKPQDQALYEEGFEMIFDPDRCIRCGLCARRCPTYAVTMEAFTFEERLTYEEVPVGVS